MYQYANESAKAVGLRLRRLRMAAGLEQEQLAKLAEVSKTSISYWETARYNKLSARSVPKLLKAIRNVGVDCLEEWLLRGIGPEPRISFRMAEAATPYQALPSLPAPIIEVKELDLFTAQVPEAVVTEISHDQLHPWLRKGDFVGGVWRSAKEIKKSDFCIVALADQLPVYYATPAKGSKFNLSYALDADVQETHTFTRLAPIVRVWRRVSL